MYTDDEVYSETLMCFIKNIRMSQDTVTFFFPLGSNCDMSGAIKIATTILPGVRRIKTFSGLVMDTCYSLVNGTWIVI